MLSEGTLVLGFVGHTLDLPPYSNCGCRAICQVSFLRDCSRDIVKALPAIWHSYS